MKKRELKKRVRYSISAAIDYVLIHSDSKQVEAKAESLLNLYDEMLKEINRTKSLPKGKSVKAHFNQLKKDFNSKITGVFDGLK